MLIGLVPHLDAKGEVARDVVQVWIGQLAKQFIHAEVAGTDPSLQHRPLHWPSGASPGPFFLASLASKALSPILGQLTLELHQAIYLRANLKGNVHSLQVSTVLAPCPIFLDRD